MQSYITKKVASFDEKWSWRCSKILRWYYYHLFLAKCTEVGQNLQLGTPLSRPHIWGAGKIKLGSNITIYGKLELLANTGSYADSEIRIDDNTSIGPNTIIAARKKIHIGRNCLIAQNVTISDNIGHPIDPTRRLLNDQLSKDEIEPIMIGDNVWIGEYSSIQQGVTIGNNSIVGAHSLVKKDVPPNTIVLGIPARVIMWLQKPGDSTSNNKEENKVI